MVCGNWENEGNNEIIPLINEIYPTIVSAVKRGMPLHVSRIIFEVQVANSLLNKSYEVGNYEDYVTLVSRSVSFAKLFMLLRRVKVEMGGFNMLLYNEKNIYVKKKLDSVDKIMKIITISPEVQPNSADYKVQSLIDFKKKLVDWVATKITLFNYEMIDQKRLTQRCYTLAIAGAERNVNKLSVIREQLMNQKLVKLESDVTTLLMKSSSLVQSRDTINYMEKVLVCDNNIYGMYYQNISKLGMIQSLSSVNMDIVRFWLLHDSLPTNKRNEVFKRVFAAKLTEERLKVMTNVKINSKGKFERLYDTNPSVKLKIIGETESIYNACYAIDLKGSMYDCVLIKEFDCRVTRVIIRN
jgi:hypothetical protein